MKLSLVTSPLPAPFVLGTVLVTLVMVAGFHPLALLPCLLNL